MRVVLISPESPGESSGGIATYTATVARALSRLGHEVAVISRGPAAGFEALGVEATEVGRTWLPSVAAERALGSWQLARAVARHSPNLVQATEWEADAWWIARSKRLPLVTRLATPTYLLELLNRGRLDPRTDLIRRLERDQASRSTGLLAPSAALAERVSRDWGLDRSGIRVIPNPIDGEAIRASGLEEPGVDLPERFVAFIGRLERRKGVAVLARALVSVLRDQADLHAVFVGRDAGATGGMPVERLMTELEPVKERVHLLGGLDRSRALAVLARASLVVLPSLWEAFGFVAAEAMALGLPVVASDGSGFAEIVEHDRSGWLVPPGDPDALAQTIGDRIDDTAGLERVRAGALRRAEQFEAAAIATRLVEFYEQLLERTDGTFDRSIYTAGYRRHFRPEESSGPFRNLYELKRRAVLSALLGRARMRILDVGAGPGRLSAPLAKSHDVTATDISEEMLHEARHRCPPGVRFVQADARELPFEDGEFDAVLALDLVTHLPNLRAGVHELTRVVRPGGTVIFDTTNASPWWVLAYPSYVNWRPRRLLRTMRLGGVLPEWRHVVRHHRADEARAAMRGVGLELEREESFGPPWSPKWQLWHATRKDE